MWKCGRYNFPFYCLAAFRQLSVLHHDAAFIPTSIPVAKVTGHVPALKFCYAENFILLAAVEISAI